MTLINALLLLANFTVLINSLNLRSHGIHDNFYTSSIAVFRNRAYLTLPRSSCYNNLTHPTLIEVYWNADKENLVAGRKITFPSENHQKWGKCDQLQDAVSVDVEVKKGRLWVLDRGTKKCPPKIIIYNLYNNNEIYKYELDKVVNKNVTFLVVDSSGEQDVMGYIGHDDNVLTIFSMNDEKHWSLQIDYENKTEVPMITRHVAISKTSPVLYISVDESSELFSVNLTEIKKSKKVPSTFVRLPKIQTKFVGYKLGPSGGIIADIAGGLNYFLTRDFAVVRWITSEPLMAEYHEIIKQSFEELPYAPHLFNGPQNSIWALVNPSPPLYCNNEIEKRKTKPLENKHHLHNRIIKLFRLKRKVFSGNLYVLEKRVL